MSDFIGQLDNPALQLVKLTHLRRWNKDEAWAAGAILIHNPDNLANNVFHVKDGEQALDWLFCL